jgi:hypothetical protein
VLAAVDAALSHGEATRRVTADGDFYSIPGQTTIQVRNRECVVSATLRQPEMIPPAEIREAVLQIVNKHVGVSVDETVVAACRLLGFRSTGSQLKRVISRELDRLVAENALRLHDAKLFESATFS